MLDIIKPSSALTPFGKFNKEIRWDTHESQRDMAKRLGVTAAFLSALEVGRTRIPDTIVDRMRSAYELSEEQVRELRKAIYETNGEVDIPIDGMEAPKKDMVIEVAVSVDSMDDADAHAITEQIRSMSRNGKNTD